MRPLALLHDHTMSLKDWITRHLGGSLDATERDDGGRVDLAVAALLVEVLRADYDVAPQERQQVVVSVSRLLGLDATVSAALVEEAERHIDKSHDLYQFTSQVNRAWSDTEKLRLLEALWRVAAADEAVHKYEEHLIRRVADLLHVPHSGFIKAKLRATEPRADE
ncbi:MAG TPA: TerB family tellurite resistance protein [Steroidobacteraceae bacterium]